VNHGLSWWLVVPRLLSSTTFPGPSVVSVSRVSALPLPARRSSPGLGQQAGQGVGRQFRPPVQVTQGGSVVRDTERIAGGAHRKHPRSGRLVMPDACHDLLTPMFLPTAGPNIQD
jgi:hypothetical protein